jgi:hypothetical protein
MRRIVSAAIGLVASFGLVAAMATTASAKVIDHSAGHQDVTITDDEVCGIPVTTHIVGANPFQAKQIGQYVLFLSTGHLVFTFTTADGRWVKSSFSGPAKDISVTPLGGNLIVVHHMLAGVGLQLVASNGDKVADKGQIRRDILLNDNGTPSNPDDDIFIDDQLVKVTGNQPDIDFCGFIEDHLG